MDLLSLEKEDWKYAVYCQDEAAMLLTFDIIIKFVGAE